MKLLSSFAYALPAWTQLETGQLAAVTAYILSLSSLSTRPAVEKKQQAHITFSKFKHFRSLQLFSSLHTNILSTFSGNLNIYFSSKQNWFSFMYSWTSMTYFNIFWFFFNPYKHGDLGTKTFENNLYEEKNQNVCRNTTDF